MTADDADAGVGAAGVVVAASFAYIGAGPAAFAEYPTTGTRVRSASRVAVVLGPFVLLGDSAVGRIRGWALRIEDNTAAEPGDTGRPQLIPRLGFGRNALRSYLRTEVGSCYRGGVSDVDVWSRWFYGRNYSIRLAFFFFPCAVVSLAGSAIIVFSSTFVRMRAPGKYTVVSPYEFSYDEPNLMTIYTPHSNQHTEHIV